MHQPMPVSMHHGGRLHPMKPNLLVTGAQPGLHACFSPAACKACRSDQHAKFELLQASFQAL